MVEEPILKSIQASVATGLEVEESTDTAIVRPLDACQKTMVLQSFLIIWYERNNNKNLFT